MNGTQQPAEHVRSSLPYFAYTGSIIGATVLLTFINRIRLGDRGWMFTHQLVAIGLVSLAFAVPVILRSLPAWAQGTQARMRWLRGKIEDPQGTHVRRLSMLYWLMGAIEIFRGTRLSFGASVAEVRDRPLAYKEVSLETFAGWLETFIYILAAAALLFLDHRRYLIIVAVLEVAAVLALRPDWRSMRFPLTLLSVLTWALTAGMMYTHLGDWLLNGSPWSAFAVVSFSGAFALVVSELCNDAPGTPERRETFWFLVAGLIAFSAFALRTDNFYANWVPLHRSYFADVAQFVRDGHWLLWDVPSTYGFLSILTLAVIPASNGWEALYELTAVFLIAQACIAFTILRWGRSGWINGFFAVLFPLGAIFGESISRYPWGARLYPQGGMRFMWVDALLFIAFLTYVWRDRPQKVRVLRWLGQAIWLIAVFWSIDNALWTTIIWIPYLVLDAFFYPTLELNVRAMLKRFVRRAWPIAGLPVFAAATIYGIYHARLGASPDWLSFVEFTGMFASGTVRAVFHVQDFGASWIILLSLGATGTLALLAIANRKFELCRLLVASWLAIWGTATYFALEPLDMYVTLLLAVLTPAAAIAVFASREGLISSASGLLARLGFIPLAVIVIALTFGEPERLAQMEFPLMSGWQPRVIQTFPPIYGELQEVMTKAGIKPDDQVLVPNGPYWTEANQGMIMPFARLPDGSIREYKAWLPMSPVGPQEMIEALPLARRRLYFDRFLAHTATGGWYITYRQPADCSVLSRRLHTARSYGSTNYSVSKCVYK